MKIHPWHLVLASVATWFVARISLATAGVAFCIVILFALVSAVHGLAWVDAGGRKQASAHMRAMADWLEK